MSWNIAHLYFYNGYYYYGVLLLALIVFLVLLEYSIQKKKEKIVLVGAASGIGYLLCEELEKFTAQHHHDCQIICIDRVKITPEMKASFKKRVIACYQCDITDYDHVNQVIESIREVSQDKIFALIHTAAILERGAIEYLQLDDYQRSMEVNFFAVIHFTKALLPLLKAHQGGSRLIYLSSSVAGLTTTAFPLYSVYCATKHALEAWITCLRMEVSFYEIDVIVINPGLLMKKTPPIMLAANTRMEETYQRAYQHDASHHGKTAPAGAVDGPYFYWPWNKEWLQQYLISSHENALKTSEDPTVVVVKDLVHALFDSQPKIRYHCGYQAAKLGGFYRWLRRLPETWRDSHLFKRFQKTMMNGAGAGAGVTKEAKEDDDEEEKDDRKKK